MWYASLDKKYTTCPLPNDELGEPFLTSCQTVPVRSGAESSAVSAKRAGVAITKLKIRKLIIKRQKTKQIIKPQPKSRMRAQRKADFLKDSLRSRLLAEIKLK